MLIIASREEKELLERLRRLGSQDTIPVSALNATIIKLKEQISQLEIDKAKKEEEFARGERELKHMVGLERKRQEVEVAQAKKEAELNIREQNLAADKKRFEETIEFNNRQFGKMEDYMKSMMTEILKRLPEIKVKM